jgi:Ca2+-binding EF-hand superfamily protein
VIPNQQRHDLATIDTNRSGNIDRQQFVDVMCRLDEDTTADEASLVFDHFDISNNGRMNYNEFLKMIVGGEGKQKSSALALALALGFV